MCSSARLRCAALLPLTSSLLQPAACPKARCQKPWLSSPYGSCVAYSQSPPRWLYALKMVMTMASISTPDKSPMTLLSTTKLLLLIAMRFFALLLLACSCLRQTLSHSLRSWEGSSPLARSMLSRPLRPPGFLLKHSQALNSLHLLQCLPRTSSVIARSFQLCNAKTLRSRIRRLPHNGNPQHSGVSRHIHCKTLCSPHTRG